MKERYTGYRFVIFNLVTRVNTDLLPKTKKPELSLNWQVNAFLLFSNILTISQMALLVSDFAINEVMPVKAFNFC